MQKMTINIDQPISREVKHNFSGITNKLWAKFICVIHIYEWMENCLSVIYEEQANMACRIAEYFKRDFIDL